MSPIGLKGAEIIKGTNTKTTEPGGLSVLNVHDETTHLERWVVIEIRGNIGFRAHGLT